LGAVFLGMGARELKASQAAYGLGQILQSLARFAQKLYRAFA